MLMKILAMLVLATASLAETTVPGGGSMPTRPFYEERSVAGPELFDMTRSPSHKVRGVVVYNDSGVDDLLCTTGDDQFGPFPQVYTTWLTTGAPFPGRLATDTTPPLIAPVRVPAGDSVSFPYYVRYVACDTTGGAVPTRVTGGL